MPKIQKSVARYVLVEYQPNLVRPSAPIPLGVVLHFDAGDGWAVTTLVGRTARRDARGAAEFKEFGSLGFDLIAGWLTAFMRDLTETNQPLENLLEKWQRNLYVTDVQERELPVADAAIDKKLELLAIQLYREHVGEPVPVVPQSATGAQAKPRPSPRPQATSGWRPQRFTEMHAP